ncbi:hypothetical protein N7519_010289 [Penicillium mononematosum]|uniref:uncharacterized protein n=1 Tax=Penicillium mononematosum TaxID=268346 RepID=UPI0025484411|nr:uncharacterized protein N7519_010289 [Penicillium mononematosum]KAJ6179828.1 hypothetical protein N7519_010289 [Penicillium mononematosum]
MAFTRLLKIPIFLFTVALGLVIYQASQSSSLQSIASSPEEQSVSSYFGSWKTWFHPSQPKATGSKQSLVQGWNVLHHLGGNGPWIENAGEGAASNLAPPDGCSVDQVHLLSRHGERYPTPSAGSRHLQFLKRVKEIGLPLNGSLEFLNDWTYFSDTPERDFGELTSTGPYAGTLGAFRTGVRFRTRYRDLVSEDIRTRLWASDSDRVIDTARHFASGFFGLDWESSGKAQLQVIPESFERGADTLTPGDTCLKYLEDTILGHDNGMEMLAQFQETYIPAIASRLIDEDNVGLNNLSSEDVYGMQEMCGFETMVRGRSPWCEVFTEQDWYNFEYARDLLLYYRAGPGNPYAGAMGWLWLNATTGLLHDGPIVGSMFLSFVHDGDIAPFLTALGIFTGDKKLLPTHIAANREWRISPVLPMGARVTVERLSCSPNHEDPYVRVLGSLVLSINSWNMFTNEDTKWGILQNGVDWTGTLDIYHSCIKIDLDMAPRDRIPANQCLPKVLDPSMPDKFTLLRIISQNLPFSSSHFFTSLPSAFTLSLDYIPSTVMEYHSVPPEERARDEDGNLLPWGYVYKDESRNPRRPPEESGPFGKRRNARYDNARSRTRTGTPAKRENPNVAEFGRLFSQQQQEEEKTHGLPKSSSSSSLDNPRKQTEKVATECILYGYKNKDNEWKVIDKYERISQGMICEDYPRNDPNSANQYTQLLSGGDVVIRNLSADANRKSKRYAGGYHWIKVTYDSTQSADRACFYSPQEIDGHMVFCELYSGHGPAEDAPIPADSAASSRIRNKAPRTLTTSHSTAFLSNSSKDQDRMTLPRSFAMNNLSSVPDMPEDERHSVDSSTVAGTSDDTTTSTATSATATATATPSFQQGSFNTTTSSSTWTTGASSSNDRTSVHQRRAPGQAEPAPDNEFMTHIPTVRRTKLRPMVEALPPQPTMTERILRSIPILSWFTGDIVGEGPQLREDGTFDSEKSGLYWRFWHTFDYFLRTDMCGLKEDS